MGDRECCANCAYLFRKHRPSTIEYCCTKDGTDRRIGLFCNYTGMATNVTAVELEHRRCVDFKPIKLKGVDE